MKNFSFTAVNPDTKELQVFWYSRSVAGVIVVFAENKYGEICILANKRGQGCPDFVGYWCCPCGYLDFNESIEDAVIRECREETGITLNKKDVHFINYSDSLEENNQNVVFRFVAVLPKTVKTSNIENEKDETEEIKWIPLTEVKNYNWAFKHDELITCAIFTGVAKKLFKK